MLFRRETLQGIASGTVTLAFRRWKRPTVRAGGTLRTALGVVSIVGLAPIRQAEITAADARRAGFSTRRELLDELARRGEGRLYRVELSFVGRDPRVGLRSRRLAGASETTELLDALSRLDRASKSGPWVEETLATIAAEPGVRAADLAQELGLARDVFKRRVRRLKEHGLTESLEVGYRLSPRGRDALPRLRAQR